MATLRQRWISRPRQYDGYQELKSGRMLMAEFDPKTGYNPDHVARSIRIEIDAPASVVWDVLVDLPKYGEWNPFCVKCISTLEMGAPVVMTIAMPWDPSEQATMTEYLCAFEP